MRHIIIFLTCLIAGCHNLFSQDINYSVEKIWDNGKHCAFTSLIKYKGNYYCSFREGESHIFDSKGEANGKVRILQSPDGNRWKSVALIGKQGFDLRDPKLSITPDGRLMVIIGGSIYRNKALKAQRPQVLFSSDGKNFSEPQDVELEEPSPNNKDWIWRVTWHNGTGYSIVYSMGGSNEATVRLAATTDGIHFKYITSPFEITGFPNEATVRFLGDTMYGIVRREKDGAQAYWGRSEPPYTKWEWQKMDIQVGGPDFIAIEPDFFILGTRSYYIPRRNKTILLTGNEKGIFEERIVLPSGADCSYPGLLIEGDELWVSYYSGHGSKNCSIYFAKIPLKLLKSY